MGLTRVFPLGRAMLCLSRHLAASLASAPISIFAGAGISWIPPTKLPLWDQFNKALINRLAESATKLAPVWHAIVQEILRRIGDEELPSDYLSQIISHRIGIRYFSVLKSLDVDQPNPVHQWLAEVAAARHLPFIITTNFDTLIERALRMKGVPCQVLTQPEDFAIFNHHCRADLDRCYLLKIHGSVLEPEGRLVDTLSQRLVGLPEPIGITINWVLDHFPIYFLGSSGKDLRAGQDYLHLQRGEIHNRKLFWVTRPGTEPLPVVTQLLDFCRTRGATAELLSGLLPDDLPPAPTPSAGGLASPLGMAPVEELSTPRGFARVLAEWGDELGPLDSALLLADFSDHIGAPQLGIDALQRVLPTDPYQPVGEAAPLAIRLAEMLARKGDQPSWDRALALLNLAERSWTLQNRDCKWLIARARIFAGGTRFDDAIRELSAITGASGLPEAQMLEAAAAKAECLRRLGRWREALREYERGAVEAARCGYPLFEGRCRLAAGELLGRFGAYAEAEKSVADAGVAFRRVGATRDLAEVPLAQARLSLQQQRYSDVTARAEQAAAAAVISSNLVAEARARILWAEGLYQTGKRASAASVASRASELATTSGDARTQAECTNMEFRLALDGASDVHFVPQTPEEVGSKTPASRFKFYMMKAWRYLTAREGQLEQAFEWMALAEIEVDQFTATEAIVGQMKLCRQFGQLLNRGNNPDSAFAYFTRFRSLIEEFMPQDSCGVLQGIANQADSLRRAGRFRDASALYDEGVAWAERLPTVNILTPQMKFYQAIGLLRYGFVDHSLAKLASATIDAEKAAEAADATDAMLAFLMRINDLISVCYLELDRANDGRDYVGRAFGLAQILGADKGCARFRAEAFVTAARYRVAAGERQQAHLLLKEARTIAESPISLEGNDEDLAEILCLLAKNSEPRNLYDAQRMLRHSVEIWERWSLPLLAAPALRQLADCLLMGGDAASAEQALLQAEIYFQRLDNPFGLGLCALSRAHWARYTGLTSRAKEHANAALRLLPEHAHPQAAIAASIAADPGGYLPQRGPAIERWPHLVAQFRGPARIVCLYHGDIRHAAGRYANPYDLILFFSPMGREELVGHARQVARLRHSNRDVGGLLEDIARLCASNGAQTVAAMPFGGAENRPILDWIRESGPPHHLDIYFLDSSDYLDIIGSSTPVSRRAAL